MGFGVWGLRVRVYLAAPRVDIYGYTREAIPGDPGDCGAPRGLAPLALQPDQDYVSEFA